MKRSTNKQENHSQNNYFDYFCPHYLALTPFNAILLLISIGCKKLSTNKIIKH